MTAERMTPCGPVAVPSKPPHPGLIAQWEKQLTDPAYAAWLYDSGHELRAIRLQPTAVEAEQAALGALLMGDEAALDVCIQRGLNRRHFSRESHRIIISACRRPVDRVTVTERLRREGQLEAAGGAEYVLALVHACPSSANIAAYLEPIFETSRLRALMGLAERLGDAAAGRDQEPETLMQQARQLLDDIERLGALGQEPRDIFRGEI